MKCDVKYCMGGEMTNSVNGLKISYQQSLQTWLVFYTFLLKYLQIASISQTKISWMNFQPEPMWHFVVLRNFDEKWGRDADFMSPL